MRGRRRKPGKRGRKVVGALVPALPQIIRLLGGLIRDRRVSLLHKGVLAGVLLYVVSPLDLIPDVLGFLGWTDDLFLVGLAVRQLVRGAGDDVVRRHWKGSPAALRTLQDGLEDVGALLPGPVRRLLAAYAERW